MKIKASRQRKNVEILVRVSTEQRQQINDYAERHNLSQAEAIRLILEDVISKDLDEVERQKKAG